MRITLTIICLLLSAISLAQEVKSPELLIKNDSLKYLKLDKLSISVEVIENLATTTMTMRFYNNTNKTLEGELNFPLGEGQNISRFAMDVNGKIREGVVVEKAKGTEVFESIVYRNVDPGLLEMTEGNNFKTRVYPIDPKGYKTVIVAFEHNLNVFENQFIYLLPLNFNDTIKEFDVNVNVIESEYVPLAIDNKLITLKFDKIKKGYKSVFSKSNFNADFQLGFNIPIQDKKDHLLTYRGTIDSTSYFYKTGNISSKIKVKDKPKGITIYWDNSGSALSRDLNNELKLLHDYFSWASNVKVELITFSNEAEDPLYFDVKDSNWGILKNHLKKLRPDGGTLLGKINVNVAKYDDIILFSDGLSNYGDSQIQLASKSVSIINSCQVANHTYLKFIAQSTGGFYINLNNTTVKNALALITTEKIQLLKVEHEKDEILDLFINNHTEDIDRYSFVGKVNSTSADLVLHFGYPGKKTLYTQKVSIENKKVPVNNLIERYWVQQKLNYLNVNFQGNKDEITAIGKKYGMVTKTTSLIVLDDIMDYVAHNILPPKELQEEYYELLKTKKKAEKLILEDRLEFVNDQYKDKVDWWKTDWKKIAEEKREMARLDSLKRIERARINSIIARQMFVNDSIQEAEQIRLDIRNKAIEDSISRINQVKNDSLLLVRNSSPLKEITGIVYDATDNSPLIGANIIIKGTTNGAITDVNGRFTLRVPEKAILSFGFIGFETQNIDVSDLFNLLVKLHSNEESLEEVVVIGYGVQKHSTITAAISTIRAESISNIADPFNTENHANYLYSTIELKEWDPQVPYLDSIKQVNISNAYSKYLDIKNQHLDNPSYFLDVATFFMNHNDTISAIRILSNLAEMQMQNHEILRVLGRKLLEFGEIAEAIEVFKQVLELRPFEPHSYRDLGLAYAENKNYQKAIETLYKIITTQWSEHIEDKFEGLEIIVIGEINSIIVQAGEKLDVSFIDKRFLINLPVDIRVVLNWDSDNTDMDLWVTDPNDEKCYYGNSRTDIGGYMSDDLTEGYGPEEFLLRNAIKGNYKIEVDYYSSSQQTISGPVTIQILLFNNFGKPNETKKRMTVRLSENQEVVNIGNLLFELNKQ